VKTSITVALALLLAYAALIGLSNSGAETASQGYWRKNRNVIASYAAARPKQAVFVGSSLTAAIPFRGFETCSYNLGLIGESALSGMDVVQGGAWRPKTVFVEVNFPDRESNAALIQSAASPLAKHFPDFVYVGPITYLAQLGGAVLRRHRPTAEAGALASAGVPLANAREAELAVQRTVFETKLSEAVLKNKLAEFAIKIEKLTKVDVEVVLVDLPIHPDLEATPRARQIRESFGQAFPSLRMLTAEVLGRGVAIKTADGLHLTEEDSSGVLRNFLPALQAACAR
jgi:hypothetical protein